MIYYVFRLFLAALHFSENSTRTQAVTMDGTRQYRISYPKGRKGEGVVKEMKTSQTYGVFFLSHLI
jgi:solute carrier family 8 (sodium/calcium exchanger)